MQIEQLTKGMKKSVKIKEDGTDFLQNPIDTRTR